MNRTEASLVEIRQMAETIFGEVTEHGATFSESKLKLAVDMLSRSVAMLADMQTRAGKKISDPLDYVKTKLGIAYEAIKH